MLKSSLALGGAPVVALLVTLGFVLPCRAAGLQDSPRVQGVIQAGMLRVCIWPDYFGISYRNPKNDQLYGIDIDLSRAFAEDLGVAIAYRETSFKQFIADLLEDQCDVAMFGVGMLPERMARVRFTRPYLKSDIYAITLKHNPAIQTWADLDRPGHVLAVQAGTFMEPVMRDRVRHATLLVVAPPRTREAELEAGRADAFMTDYPYSRRLLANTDWVRLLSPPEPFFELSYGYAVAPGDDGWLARVDAFVSAIKRDGRLETVARRHGLDAIIVRD